MNTKKSTILFLLMAVLKIDAGYAQRADSVARLASAYFHEAEHAAANQAIWKQKLYGPMLFVDENTRTAWANMPDDGGILKPEGEIYKGTLPKSIIIANTSFDWGGKKWSMIIWPLPADRYDRLNLVLHESFHRIQDQLGLPAHSPTADHLSAKEGRIYFLLELQALKSALDKPKNERKYDLESALMFRQKRQMLFPETFRNEEILEANEGLAEYTGVILGRPGNTLRQHLEMVIEGAEKKESLIRSAPYITGPLYGCLLHDADASWTLKIDSGLNFTSLVKKYYHVKIEGNNLDADINKRLAQYDGARITASENLKSEAHEKLKKQYIDLFTANPVLVISLVNMNIGFNPNNLFDLGTYGTVYPTMTLKDAWGELDVTAGNGALMKDWHIVYLSAKDGISTKDTNTIEGKGWKLTLVNGWKLVADGSNFKLVKE